MKPQILQNLILHAVTPVLESSIANTVPPAEIPAWSYQSGSGLFPNQANAYMAASVDYYPDQYLIITGLAPTYPDTNAQAIVQTPPTELRYWSLCTNIVVSPGPVVDCADDQHTQLFLAARRTLIPLKTQAPFDATFPTLPIPAGAQQYAYLIAQQQPQGIDADVPWLYFYNKALQQRVANFPTLILRNMDADSSFEQAVQQIPIRG